MHVVITKRDVQRIRVALSRMLVASCAHSVLLIDRSGQLIAHEGADTDIDLTALSALTAANFGATTEIARLLGEEEFTLLFHKGKSENVYFSAIGEHAIMVTLFDDRTSLGLIRLRINEIAEELREILLSIFKRSEVSTRSLPRDV